MANVAMVVTNACDPDPRVMQSARWLTEQGHQVTIHAYDRQQKSRPSSMIDDVKIIRYHLGKSPYGGLFKTGLGIRKFKKSVFSKLILESSDVIVCHDADTLVRCSPSLPWTGLGGRLSPMRLRFRPSTNQQVLVQYAT